MGVEVAIGAVVGAGVAAATDGDILTGAVLGGVGGGIYGASGAAVGAEAAAGAELAAGAEIFGPGIELASSANLAAAAGASGFDALATTALEIGGEFAGVDAAIAGQAALGVLPEATVALPELLAGQAGFALSAAEVAQGFSLVNTASGVVQKLNGAGQAVAASRAAANPLNTRVGATPVQNFIMPNAQGVTGAQAAEQIKAAAEAAQQTPGMTSFSNTTIIALATAGVLLFLARGQ